MSENFLKFKRLNDKFRAIKALIVGVAAGLFVCGAMLVLSKLCVLDFEPWVSFIIGAAACLLAGAVAYFLLAKTDIALARELDKKFELHERVETMVAYSDKSGDMLDMQRDDTEKTLAKIQTKKIKPDKMWIYFTALAVGAAILVLGLFVPNMRELSNDDVPPFSLSDMQREGIEVLIKYVDKSDMQQPYRKNISDELRGLLGNLETAKTMPQMQAYMAEAMAYITAETRNSSSMTEIANALWNSENKYNQSLAKLIDTSSWQSSGWSDYAERLVDFRSLYNHTVADGEEVEPVEDSLKEELKWKLENSSRELVWALQESGIDRDDALYDVLNCFAASEGEVKGISVIGAGVESMSSAEALAALDATVNLLFGSDTSGLYVVICQQKTNADVGEYVLTKLSTMFLVPLPGFERPDFSKAGYSDGGTGGNGNSDDEEVGGSGGGVGAGSVYGSDDLVLDPMTGEYVEYGTLLNKYYTLMAEKIKNGDYTPEQIEKIQKYFDLLYGGIKKDEGN